MELRYRGSCYQANTQNIDTVETEVPAKFLGRPYQIRKAVNQPNIQSNQNLRFRGIPYAMT